MTSNIFADNILGNSTTFAPSIAGNVPVVMASAESINGEGSSLYYDPKTKLFFIRICGETISVSGNISIGRDNSIKCQYFPNCVKGANCKFSHGEPSAFNVTQRCKHPLLALQEDRFGSQAVYDLVVYFANKHRNEMIHNTKNISLKNMEIIPRLT